MGVFIGWSGKNTKSYKVADALRRWLEKVIQASKPWTSEQDIEAGQRRATELFGPASYAQAHVPEIATFYLLAENPVLNHQQQDCRLIAQVIAPDGMQTQALHLAAKSGLKDKFSGSLTFKPITEYEVRQCFQSDSGRSSGSFNLPGVLLWNLVRMNQVAMQRTPRLTPGQFGIALPACLQGILNLRNWRMPLASFSVGRIVPEAYRLYGRFVIDTFLNRQDEILALLSDGDMRRIGVELGVIPRVYYPMPTNMHYELSAFCASAMDLPLTPTFTSEGGYKIWIIRAP